jgi:hypothetical protein
LIFFYKESEERKETEGPFILPGVVGGLYKASLQEGDQLVKQLSL